MRQGGPLRRPQRSGNSGAQGRNEPPTRGLSPRIGEFVFSTTGETPVTGFGKAKRRLDEQINKLRVADGLEPMEHWTLHDLRRTMVTMMNEELGIAPHVIEAVVNHVSGLAKAGVVGVCNRALYLDDRRRALTVWSQYLTKLPLP